METAKTFDGSGMMAGFEEDWEEDWWTWRVASHEAEMTRLCSRLYTTDLTPASCVLRTVCAEVVVLVWRTSQSRPAEKNSSSFAPKQTSSTGAWCSKVEIREHIFWSGELWSDPIVYRYTFLSQDETRNLDEFGSGENFTAEIASDGGVATGNWSRACQ